MSTGAIDPFEEFLRKKKVEKLEEKYRREREGTAGPDDEIALVEDDPNLEEKLREEMDEFLKTGQAAGAEYFSKLKTNIGPEQVEEIKDALEDVFEEELVATPQTEGGPDDTFVQFFQQVQDKFISPGGEAPPAATPEEEVAGEIVDAHVEAGPKVSSPAPDAPEPRASEERRLDLAAILAEPAADTQQVAQRVDLLCRLVAKVVERLGIPEGEIVEVLIKSGVQF
jgi:hypothetical protein